VNYVLKEAQRRSFHEVPETCPDIDRGLSNLDKIIKEKTSDFREALNNALELAIGYEDQIDILTTEKEELENEILNLKEQLVELQKETT
jgi:chromosome segregation ATPase